MGNLYKKAYLFYKNLYANSLILFHIATEFQAYEDDAIYLAQILNEPVLYKHEIKCCSFPDYALEDMLLLLVQMNIPVQVIEYRDSNGLFTVPKVKQIMDDILEDY